MSLVRYQIVRLVDYTVDPSGIFRHATNHFRHFCDLFIELCVHSVHEILIEVDGAVVYVVADILGMQEHFVEPAYAFIKVHFLDPEYPVDVMLYLAEPFLNNGLQGPPDV